MVSMVLFAELNDGGLGLGFFLHEKNFNHMHCFIFDLLLRIVATNLMQKHDCIAFK